MRRTVGQLQAHYVTSMLTSAGVFQSQRRFTDLIIWHLLMGKPDQCAQEARGDMRFASVACEKTPKVTTSARLKSESTYVSQWRRCMQTHKHSFVFFRTYTNIFEESQFTHIIQFRHDGAAAPHFKPKQVNDLLRVSQWFQDVHDASCVLLLLCQAETLRYAPHPNDATPGCRGGENSRENCSCSPTSSDRLTLPIGSSVMALEQRIQWAARASGVMSRLSLWLVS